MTSPYLELPCRTLGQATDIAAAHTVATMIETLHDTIKRLDVDALGDCLHYLDEACGAAKAAEMRLRDEQPGEKPYFSSRVL